MQVKPVRKELHAAVRRDQLLKLIETIRNMVETAEDLDGQLECLGDSTTTTSSSSGVQSFVPTCT